MALGGEEFVWARPDPRLRPLLTRYSGYRTVAGPAGTHQGVPGAHLTVQLCLDGTVDMLALPDPARRPASFTTLVAGLHDRPAVIRAGPAQTGIELQLTWRGARALLGLPAGALAGDVVDLAALLGPRVEALRTRLAAARTWRGRFDLLDRELLGLTAVADDAAAAPAPEVGRAWDLLASSGGTVRVGELAADVGWSRRHLAGRFRAETGLGLKSAARVIRFGRACDLLRAADRPSLADTAATCGYADQPHLAREFRDLAGITATRWLAERPADSG